MEIHGHAYTCCTCTCLKGRTLCQWNFYFHCILSFRMHLLLYISCNVIFRWFYLIPVMAFLCICYSQWLRFLCFLLCVVFVALYAFAFFCSCWCSHVIYVFVYVYVYIVIGIHMCVHFWYFTWRSLVKRSCRLSLNGIKQ